MHLEEINTKNKVYNCYFENYVKAKKLETKHILIYDNLCSHLFLLYIILRH